MVNKSRLVIGCGYLGERVAQRWLAEGSVVHCVTRSLDRARRLESLGFEPFVGDVTQPDTLVALPAADTVLYAVGYQPGSGVSRRAVYVDGLQAVLDRLDVHPSRIVLASSTGVYGESGGAWVDEETPCRPAREAGQVLLAAEKTLRGHRLGSAAIVLRFAGLYGPGRIPKLADLKAGRPIAVSSYGMLNLIHIDDAAAAVVAAAQAPPPRTYVIADGHPVLRREFYRHVTKLLRAAEPQFVEPSSDEAARQRGGGDKRVSNRRMIEELGVILQYPTYRAGLEAILAASAG